MSIKTVTVKIDKELIERVDKISKSTGMKKKAIINMALKVYLDEFEKSLEKFNTIIKLERE